MEERKVKGTMLLELVRQIRANKDKDWNKFLKPEDWEIIVQTILPSSWYPIETYERCGWAVFNVLGKQDPDLARLRGKMRGRELFGGVYKGVLNSKGPRNALKGFEGIYELLFNFSSIKFEELGEKHALVKHNYDKDDPANLPYCYTLLGHLETLIELAGGKNVKSAFTSKQWEGDPATNLEVTWE